MKNKLKNIIGYNIKSLIGFEIVYKLISLIIFMPLFLNAFSLITKISGYDYLTFENFTKFLLNPMVIFFLLVLLILITFYTIIDISTIIIILDGSYAKKKIKIRDAFILACQKSVKIFHKENILLPFLVLFLMPFLNLFFSTSFISTINIPEFILEYIINNNVLFIIYIILIIFLTIILFRWLYSLHYFVLEDCNFKEAKNKSINLSKKYILKDYLFVIGLQLLILLSYFIFIFIGIILIVLIYKLFNTLGSLPITIIWLLIMISFLIFTLLKTPISYAIISILYYYHKEKIKEPIKNLNLVIKEKTKVKRRMRILKYVVIILSIFSATIFTYSILNGDYDLNIEYFNTMEITAHRGASRMYPENTMSAFIGAKELGADWIELDVQQTKDRKLIVLHDTNLKRTTGVNKNSWEVTYEEIKDLDAGTYLNKKFKKENIPLLEEVIKYAKDNNIKLNIELKPTGYEENFEYSVVNLVKSYNYENNVVITSQVYDVLANVKKVDKNIKTVYVMSLAYGNITKLKYADIFSIEESSVTKTLVSKIHNNGKKLYAWTVNNKNNINKMIKLKVDNIITDDILLAKETIYKSKTSNIINEYINLVNEWLS